MKVFKLTIETFSCFFILFSLIPLIRNDFWERDKELLLVADMAKDNKNSVIVLGDLNDVA